MNQPLSIFDLDGTLVDLCEVHRVAFAKALKEVANLDLTEDQVSSLEGLPTREKCRRLGLNPNFIEHINQLKQQFTDLSVVKPNDRVLKAVAKARRFGLVAVYSNSVIATVQQALSNAGLAHMIDVVIGNDSLMVKKPKPDSQGYEAIMALLGANADSTIIYEDSPAGIEAARRSGARVVIVKDQLVGPEAVSDPALTWE